MSEDYSTSHPPLSHIRAQVLHHIHSMLQTMGSDINDYHLVDHTVTSNEEAMKLKEIREELNILISEEDLLLPETLNVKQREAYDIIVQTVFGGASATFFIDGPGGTGKTYLYRAILATVRSRGMIALATASSGVAAILLPGGRTAHSRFKIPLTCEKDTICTVSKQSGLAKLLQCVKLIIWDEAPMSHHQSIEALDLMLKDINDSAQPFGGKVVVLGGDFRQVLPIVQKARREETIDATLVKSYLWPLLHKIQLTENMRARLDPSFCKFLLRVGNGEEPTNNDEKIEIPASMIIPYEDDTSSLKNLINNIFPNLDECASNTHMMIHRAILTPKNEYVDHINNLLIQQFPGNVTTYYSYDENIDSTEQKIEEDFLHSYTPSGFPPHQLLLKLNCPITLLRNINPSEGLCNGTQLLCRRFSSNLVDAEIVSGQYSGKRVFLPRIPFTPIENQQNLFPFKRTQFPIRLSFAMTINKAQGQSLEHVGLYLLEPIWKMERQIKSIKEIFPRSKNWICKVLVAEKHPPRNSRRNSSIFQHLLLVDKEGTRIQATIFEENIQKYEKLIIMFKTYNISNALVNFIPQQYRIVDNKYQWIINEHTAVKEVEDEEIINAPQELYNFSFVPFNALEQYKSRTMEVDILALVIDIQPRKYIPTSSGVSCVRELTLLNEE
ncbi:uncharacterized protein LOC133815480 [Humulus lupulus]|uniref:uncharacterized protein LOC133815480 n=1 Tax=Humulus lupulus TaxID=3486 RepID=UPI002B414063|nr:uncharacterized protein LOC133815480 [Humulus lupulus]